MPSSPDVGALLGQAEVCNPEEGGGRQVSFIKSTDKRPFSLPSWERDKKIFTGCSRLIVLGKGQNTGFSQLEL